MKRSTWQNVLFFILGIVVGFLAFHPPGDAGHNIGTEVNMAHDMSTHPSLEVPADELRPAITLEALVDTKDGYNLNLKTTNFRFTPELVGQTPQANTGHAHLYVNGVKVARLYGEWFHLANTKLSAGENIILVTLNANDHSEWVIDGQHIAASTTISR